MRHLAVPFVTALVGVLACPTVLALDMVMLWPAQDNTLYESASGALSSGAGPTMFVGRTAQPSGSIRRGVLAFDVASAIPAGSIVTDVQLTLHSDQFANVQDESISLHRVLSAWGEGGSLPPGAGGGGAPASAGDATWLHTFFPGQFWASPGGDFAAGASAATLVGGAGYYVWQSPGLIADVQAWVDNPAADFGWLLLGNESAASTAKRFASREDLEPTFRPLLHVEYVPEPATGMLAVAAVAVLGGVRRPR